jgi:class 3 adenylate cyclase
MAEVPDTLYARTPDGLHIAYHGVGEGPVDLVVSNEWVTHVEAALDHPLIARTAARLASFSRVIEFDKRGIGLSDRVAPSEVPSLEAWVEDLNAVLDSVGSERAVILGTGHGGQLAMLFGVTHPERVAGLILVNAYARLASAPDYEFGYPPAIQEFVLAKDESEWGATGWVVDYLAPSLAGDPTVKEWFTRIERLACTPGTGVAMQRAMFDQDVRSILHSICVPTLVMHTVGNRHVRVDHGRYLAEHIPGAQYVELPGDDHWFLFGPSGEAALKEIAGFVGAAPQAVETDRLLTTILFTDVVDSTRLARDLGDRRWHDLLDRLDDLVRRTVERFQGRVVKSTGDGHLASFDGPGRAIRCARFITDGAQGLGMQLRCGIHTGEVERRGDDLAGIAVHLAQRISALAVAHEVLVSRTVVDLVAGSGMEFEDRGERELKGLPAKWRLLRVVD